MDHLRKPCKQKLKFTLVDKDIVDKTIKELNVKKSCGHDNISTILLKAIQHIILGSLTLIINQCITTNIFPDKLKIAKVIPIYKKDDDDIFDNYRPISLLPTISRVFERNYGNTIN